MNGDGKIDILSLDTTNFDAYTAYYSQTATYFWRLNNGDPNINNWPTTTSFLSLRVTDPSSPAAPFVDLNGDGIPDKIVGIALSSSNRGPYGTSTGGQRVYLGRADGTYQLQSSTGLGACRRATGTTTARSTSPAPARASPAPIRASRSGPPI